jgi:hypothetical protein
LRWPPRGVPSVAAVAVVALGGLLGAIIAPPKRTTSRARFETVVGSGSGGVLSPFQLKAAFLAYDSAWGKVWRSHISVAPTDPIKLQLRVQNLAPTPTPDLEVGLIDDGQTPAESITSETFTPGFYIAGEAGEPVVGPSATIHTVVPADSPFEVTETKFATSGSVTDAATPVSSATELPPKGKNLATTFNLGILAPGAAAIVTFGTSFIPVHSGQLDTGDQTVARELPNGRSARALSVEPGDRLQIVVRLADDYFGEGIIARAAIRRRSARVESVAAYASPYGSPNEPLGASILTGTSGPIALRVIPNTTTVRRPSTECTRNAKATRLPNGVAEGGVMVGIVGDYYKPRDPCHGKEFDKLLMFDIAVTRR